MLPGVGCRLGNLAGAGAQILPNPTGIHSALPCVGAKGHHQGLGFQGPRCGAGAWPSSALCSVQGGSWQGGFQRAGKQRPDGTQIPAQRHPPSRVCTAPMLICSREGFSLCWTSAAVPGRHPSSPAGLLHYAPGQVPALLQVSLTHSLSSQSQAPADAQSSSNTDKRAGGLQVPQQCWAGGMWHHWTPLQLGRAEGLLLSAPAQAAEVAAEDARHALHTCWSTSHPALVCSATRMLPALLARSSLGSSSLPSSPFCHHTQQPSQLLGETEARGWQD